MRPVPLGSGRANFASAVRCPRGDGCTLVEALYCRRGSALLPAPLNVAKASEAVDCQARDGTHRRPHVVPVAGKGRAVASSESLSARGRWWRALRREVEPGLEKVKEEVGGPARVRVVLLLACILSLDSADQGAIGAVAPQLESSLRISNVELGLLVTVTAVLGGVATIPMGSLVDRTRRVRLISIAILLWGVAEGVSGASASYWMLVVTRLALAAVTATAAPVVASLTGDLFPPQDRGRTYGFIVTGEIVGAGVGVLVSGLIAGSLGWRPALAVLALPSLAVSWALWRYLPEPARGGGSWIEKGAEEIPNDEHAVARPAAADESDRSGEAADGVVEIVKKKGIGAEPDIVVTEDPSRWGLVRAIRYVLSVKTNVILIISSSVGYFFFAGLKTFALLFVRGQYQVSQGVATVLVLAVGTAAAAGIVVAGRKSDRWIRRGHIAARLDVGLVGYALGAVLLVPALLTTDLVPALPLIMLAAAGIAAPNGTLDAARLDIVPSLVWGRAEAVRTTVRTLLEAAAPLTFGLLSEAFGSNKGGFAIVASGSKSPAGSPAQVQGLKDAFLLMLVPLAVSGLVILFARKSYPVDVASAAESDRRLAADQSVEPSAAGELRSRDDKGRRPA